MPKDFDRKGREGRKERLTQSEALVMVLCSLSAF
jgi:hypothetical protein